MMNTSSWFPNKQKKKTSPLSLPNLFYDLGLKLQTASKSAEGWTGVTESGTRREGYHSLHSGASRTSDFQEGCSSSHNKYIKRSLHYPPFPSCTRLDAISTSATPQNGDWTHGIRNVYSKWELTSIPTLLSETASHKNEHSSLVHKTVIATWCSLYGLDFLSETIKLEMFGTDRIPWHS